ncbi:hypothetical protein SCA03_48250 [Streptomyces cacaoi]|uniref:Uncharacterized protein n=1 Tax=Streptomyces cacaoi TaxID=1898 RepID=A0A4Y3R400_STRCI|nr:hypothetical protein SCA03_48250 [Streptomyces cacaoi]
MLVAVAHGRRLPVEDLLDSGPFGVPSRAAARAADEGERRAQRPPGRRGGAGTRGSVAPRSPVQHAHTGDRNGAGPGRTRRLPPPGGVPARAPRGQGRVTAETGIMPTGS